MEEGEEAVLQKEQDEERGAGKEKPPAGGPVAPQASVQGGGGEVCSKEETGVLAIEQFRQVDLRVAEVVSCERVPGADRLLRLELDTGDGTRQIIAGIAMYYAPEELVGKKIIVVYNLEPAVIRGVESRGMLLAAKDDQDLAVLTVDRDVKNGSKVS
jgi:methionyl-tRNA synthetase